MCHFSLSSNQTDSYLMCIKLALLNSCVLGRSLGCSRRLQPLVNVTNFGPCHCMPWRGIPDWLRDQFAVPKLPPEPVVRSGQRKVKVHWAMAASSSRSKLVKFNDFHGLFDSLLFVSCSLLLYYYLLFI